MRAMESSVSSQRTLNPYTGWTNKFIYPHTILVLQIV